jgi:hypothetical protein
MMLFYGGDLECNGSDFIEGRPRISIPDLTYQRNGSQELADAMAKCDGMRDASVVLKPPRALSTISARKVP